MRSPWDDKERTEHVTPHLITFLVSLTSDSLRYKGAIFVQHEAIQAPSKASSETRMLEGKWVRGRLSVYKHWNRSQHLDIQIH